MAGAARDHFLGVAAVSGAAWLDDLEVPGARASWRVSDGRVRSVGGSAPPVGVTALTVGLVFERYRYKRLRDEPPGPGWVATGERLIDLAEFDDLFRHRAISIAQPDICHCGGLWETKKIAAMAEAAARVFGRATRGLHDAVEGQKCGQGELGHGEFLLSISVAVAGQRARL